MEYIDFYKMPVKKQEVFKKELLDKMKDDWKRMGFKEDVPNAEFTRELNYELRKTIFFVEHGNVYGYFVPQKL